MKLLCMVCFRSSIERLRQIKWPLTPPLGNWLTLRASRLLTGSGIRKLRNHIGRVAACLQLFEEQAVKTVIIWSNKASNHAFPKLSMNLCSVYSRFMNIVGYVLHIQMFLSKLTVLIKECSPIPCLSNSFYSSGKALCFVESLLWEFDGT